MMGLLLPTCAIFFSALLCSVFFLKKRIHLLENKMYSCMLISILLDSILASVLQIFPIGGISKFEKMLVPILNKLDYFCLLIFFNSIFLYTAIITIKKFKENFKKYIKIFFIIDIIFILVIIITNVDIIESNSNYSVEGIAVNMTYIICAIYTLSSILITLFNIKKIDKRHIPILSMIGILIVLFITFKLNPYLIIISIVLTFINYVMYFTIENPDVRMIKQLEDANRTAEKANRAKTDFLSSMSHEIRTPLNAIIGFSEAIKEDTTVEQCHEDADDIIMAGQNLLEIINGILDISKIEANKMEIVNVNYNLKETCNNIAKLIKPRIGEKPIELKVNIASDIPDTLYGDSGKIKEVITNILTNAVKYTDEGFIEFNVSCINQGDTSTLFISIEDSGRGIKKEHLEKLFSKFQRLEEDRNTTIEGTGLGLAITKSLVEMMGGRIIVQSKYGRGSKFSVYLKQQIVTMVENKEEVKETVKTDSISFADKKVLIVDDNNLNLKVAARLLKEYDLDPELVSSGFECLDKINAGSTYDLILLDDMMPKMSGVETFKKLKEINGFNIPVVILTANAISGMKEKYLEDGFNDYLAKPIDKGELKRVLNDYLNK